MEYILVTEKDLGNTMNFLEAVLERTQNITELQISLKSQIKLETNRENKIQLAVIWNRN